jgi:hypothetical protein
VSGNSESDAGQQSAKVVVALDTSVAIEVLADRAKSLTSQAIAEFLLPVPVVGELRHGALNSTRSHSVSWSRCMRWPASRLPRCTPLDHRYDSSMRNGRIGVRAIRGPCLPEAGGPSLPGCGRPTR